MPPLETLSTICGWIYTISWSASFYPQPILNYRRKSTTGTTIDFPTINVLGFFAYFASSAAFLYSPIIREQYALRHHGLTPTVELNDLAFAGHAVVLSVITYTQFWPRVWGFDKHVERGSEGRASWPMWGVYLVSVLGVGVVCILVRRAGDDPRTDWAWLDAVCMCGKTATKTG
jgi:cystinosin